MSGSPLQFAREWSRYFQSAEPIPVVPKKCVQMDEFRYAMSLAHEAAPSKGLELLYEDEHVEHL